MKSLSVTGLAFLVGCHLVLVADSYSQAPRSSVQVDTTTLSGLGLNNADIATSGDLSVVVYSDESVPAHVYATTSDAAGVTWSTPVQIDSDSSGALKVTGFMNKTHNVEVVGDAIYTVWIDERAGFVDADVYFGRSTDRGVTWSETRIDKGLPGGSTVTAQDYALSVSPDPAGDHVYIAIVVDNNSIDELYLAASHDGGLSFNPTVGVSTMNGLDDVDGVSICSDGLTVHTVFTDVRAGGTTRDDLWYRRSLDGGLTFDAELELDASGPQSGDLSNSPAIACAGNRVAVAWEEELTSNSNEEIRATVSVDGGTSFLTDTLVSTFDPVTFDADSVAVTLCGSNVIVGWDDNRLGGDASFLSTSIDDGFTWMTEVQVSTTGGVGAPRLDTNGTDLVVVSSEGSSPNVVETSWSGDCGLTWRQYFVASDTRGDTDATRAVLNEFQDNVLLMWLSDQSGENNAFVGGYSLCEAGSIATRNAGNNPSSYTATIPALGQNFTATVDMTATGHSLALILGVGSTANIPVSGGRVILINVLDPGGELLALAPVSGPIANFFLLMPSDPSFCGFFVSTQAIHFAGAPLLLTNAQDVTLTGI